jgi:hypothetical protein
VSFVHEDPEFDDLLQIVATDRGLTRGLVEKDYWVTHSLWALHAAGFEVWFKGGTSLSKGFGLIQRFSEDLDLKIEPGNVTALPAVASWRSESKKAIAERKAYFEALARLLTVPGATVELDLDSIDRKWRGANLRVLYPGRHLGDLQGVLSPFVRLEVGSARVTPFVERDLTSFVHEKLVAQDQLGFFADNRPMGVRCVHPLVTLLEKLDALHRRFPNDGAEAPTFVRHYEDAALVISSFAKLPALAGHAGVRALADDMLAQKQIVALPLAADPALAPADDARWEAIRAAHAAIAPMFWGPRIPLDEACAAIRDWIAAELT